MLRNRRPFLLVGSQTISGVLPFRYASPQGLGGVLLHRYASQQTIIGALLHRYASAQGLAGTLLHRYASLNQLSGSLPYRYASRQGLSGSLLHRYASQLGLSGGLLHRIATQQGIGGAFLHRYQTTNPYEPSVISGILRHRYRSAALLSGVLLHRYWSKPADYSPATPGWSDYDRSWQLDNDMPECTILAGGQDLGDAPSGLQITHNESAASRWQLTLMDSTGKYHPKKAGGDWEGVMTAEAFGEGDAITKTLGVTLVQAGYTYTFVGVPDSYGHARSFQSRAFDFVWSGTDLSVKLFRRFQRLDTIRAERTERLTQIDMLDDLLPRYVDSYRLHLTPVRVALQHRQDIRGGDGMQALLDLTMAQWRMDGGQLVCYEPGAGGQTWRYNSEALVYEDQLQAQASQVVNKVTIRRAVEGGRAATRGETGGKEATALYDFGQQTESFNPPINGLQWRTTGAGLVTDIICRNKEGNIVSVLAPNPLSNQVWPQHLLGAAGNNVASITYTWGQPNPNVTATAAAGTVQWFGNEIPHVDVAPPGDPEPPAYTVVMPSDEYPHAAASASQDKYGVIPVEMSPNPLLYGVEEAAEWARRYLDRNCVPPDPQSCRVPLNLAMAVGDWVEITDDTLGIVERRYITQVTHSVYTDPAQRFSRFTAIILGGT